MNFHPPARPRHLVLVLGDQLNRDSAAFDGFDPACDALWMAEVAEESTHVWSHKARIAMFLTAMRHFRDALRGQGVTVHYRQLDDPANTGSFRGELTATVSRLCPQRLIWVEPGEWRVQAALETTARALGVDFEFRADRHFFCSRDEFSRHARGRKQLRMEFFYRELRRTHRVLMDGDEPAGGAWNFDAENRESFGRAGPGEAEPPVAFAPDALTRKVLELVEKRFAKHPGSLARFDWPVTPGQARAALDDFIAHRLPHFGRYQDAMWTGHGAGPPATKPRQDAFLFHSRLSAAMNLKLLDPRVVVAEAEKGYREGRAPLASVEGFIRQILGWREYVRGIYWQFMPGYLDRNELKATQPLPAFYWTGDTDLNCLRHVIGQTLEFGYAHHIQRLMVTGLFALLLGVNPRAVHEWYLASYVDAVEWVELPNTLGMSQQADGGLMASKPYVATGKYIQRMTNYCAGCRYDPAQRAGSKACPFTTLYWDFLLRHEARLAKNPRTVMQVRNAVRLTPAQRREITDQAARLRHAIPAATPPRSKPSPPHGNTLSSTRHFTNMKPTMNDTTELTGKKAPAFKAPVIGGSFGEGATVSLADLKGQTVVLYFYPKDDTPGCTTQACALRNGWSRIQNKAAVFGVSVDSPKSHAKFIEKHGLPFPLISDEAKEIVQAYGVWVEKSMYGKKYMGTERSTVIISPDGKVKAVLRKVQPAEHLDLVLQALG